MKKYFFSVTVTILFEIITLPTHLVAQNKRVVSKESGAKKANICLTYEDALETQLSTVNLHLYSVDLKAIFFFNSTQGSSRSDIIGQTLEAVIGWTNMARNGHQLANQTLFHPCPEKIGWAKIVAVSTPLFVIILTGFKQYWHNQLIIPYFTDFL